LVKGVRRIEVRLTGVPQCRSCTGSPITSAAPGSIARSMPNSARNIARRTEENVAGTACVQTRRDAPVRFGNRAVTREQGATTNAALGLEGVWSDLSYATAQKPSAVSLRSFGLFILLECCRAPVAQEEVEVATLIGLQDTILEQFCIAAPRVFPLRW
jgi:hypothetical protein